MQRPLRSPTPLPGVWREKECPRCHRPVDLPLGAVCRECRWEIERRARRLGHLVAAVTTLVLAVYVLLRLPPDPRGRLVSAMAVGIWYLLSGMIVRRAARELLP
ncbi:MAG TPA: hypothetical protein VNL18_06570 [Gemmatimonadales bacterium]|nr:hypothetical protein [Gemmatimonadales bacterium]